MGRLSGFKYRDVVQRLRFFGYAFDRPGPGSHEVWRKVFCGGSWKDIQRFQDKWVLSNLDYARVRLFFLSLIWRMSVAPEDNMWTDVILGPDEETIRKMVHSQNPGEQWQYGFLCIIPFFNGKPIKDWLLEPECGQSDGGRMYILLVGGCLYLFHISNQLLSKQWTEGLIRKDGSWIIGVQDALEIPFIREEAVRISEAMKRKS